MKNGWGCLSRVVARSSVRLGVSEKNGRNRHQKLKSESNPPSLSVNEYRKKRLPTKPKERNLQFGPTEHPHRTRQEAEAVPDGVASTDTLDRPLVSCLLRVSARFK
jgi:hypothetical protein